MRIIQTHITEKMYKDVYIYTLETQSCYLTY